MPTAPIRRAVPPDDDDDGPPTQTGATQPIATQPIATQPIATQPIATPPSEAETADTEPVSPEPLATQDAAPGAVAAPSETVRAHRRGPGLWLPLIVFVVLLAAGGAVGRFVIPRPAPDPGAAPTGGPITAGTPGQSPSLTLPPLPTPPARPADALAAWAERIGAAIGVPPVAIQAYGYAQLLMQDNDPSCKLAWTTLAGVGEVESFHGQADGAVLATNGRSDPVIIGPVLNGEGGQPRVQDTDAGAFDGDASFDRTMGPLRLSPTMWRTYASDADADGIQDPYDIDDASLALARLLCSATDDLSQLGGWTTALGRYRSGEAYARSVFQVADGYGQRTRNIT